VLDRIDDWLARFASTPANSLQEARARAYAVYLLARQGIKPAAAISNVEQELTNRYPKAWTTDLSAAYLAATYRLMQRTADADRMIKQVPWAATKKDFTDDVYYGAVVHDAQLLFLLSRHFPAMVTGAPPVALETMSASVSGGGASSLSAAYTLLALDAYSKASGDTTTLGISEVAKDGQTRALTLPAGVIPKVSISEAAAKILFSRRGQVPAYFVLAESGFDRTPPAAELKQGVEILREFVDEKGAVLTRVTIGQEFYVRLRVRATDRDVQQQIAIVDVLPGGVEPVLELQAPADSSTPGEDPAMRRKRGAARALPVGLPEKSDWVPQHVDVREDRLVLYGDATRNIGTFIYRVRANNAGTYQVPPAFAEGMYNRTVVALGKGSTLEVIKP
jgi:alpha-2-macroglobulin